MTLEAINTCQTELYRWIAAERQAAETRLNVPANDQSALRDPRYWACFDAWVTAENGLRRVEALISGGPNHVPEEIL